MQIFLLRAMDSKPRAFIIGFCALIGGVPLVLAALSGAGAVIVFVLVLWLPLVFAVLKLLRASPSVLVGEQGIILDLPYFRRELSWSDIERGSARILSLKANPSFRFTAMVGAVGAPGYLVGWYTTEGEGDVLAAVSSDEVVSWRTNRGYTVLVSAEDAEALAHAIAG